MPIAAPSANRAGRISPTNAADAADELRGRVDLILDGGPCPLGIESTVIGFDEDRPLLLRPGAVPRQEIEDLIGPLGPPGNLIQSPGQFETRQSRLSDFDFDIVGESIPWIEAEVAAIRERHRATEKAAADRERQERAKAQEEQRARASAELQETCDRIRRDSLLRQADEYAQHVTADRDEWDADSAADFCEAVRERLAPIVKAEWTERRLKREVEDELEDWD